MAILPPVARRWFPAAVCGLLGLGGWASGQEPPAGTPADPAPAASGLGVPNTAAEASSVQNQPDAGPGAPAPGASPPAAGDGDVRRTVPPARPAPRTGFFPVPPIGPGYYSLRDALNGDERAGPPKYPYPRFGLMPLSFFDADFRYLDAATNTETDYFDPLKRVRLGDDWLFSTGGEVRDRFMSEYNSRLTQRNNDYNLSRARVYGDLWYRDDFRVYAEFISAFSDGQSLPRAAVDEDRADLQNLFVDLKVAELGGKPVTVRGGRQELLYGSQRLVSTLDWVNSRRTFQGVKAFRQGETVDADLFWVQPVVPNAGRFNSVDNNQNFAGIFTTTRPAKGQAVDLYYLLLDNTNNVVQQGIQRGRFTRNTFGGRYVGDRDGTYLWDFEGAMQLGSEAGRNVVAGFATAGLGYHWKDTPLNPTVWAYYDYASGDDRPGQGTAHTFNQLFPFGHYYFGWADQVGRQNIHDFNLHTYLYPTKWIQVDLQYHNFWLASARDALYNAGGNAIRCDPTGRAGTHVGQEVDVIVNVHLTQHADFLTGYSYLFGGDFLRRTAGRNAAVDTSLAYAQLSYRW